MPTETARYVQVAQRIAQARAPAEGARGVVDKWTVRLFPNAPHSRALRKQEAALQDLTREFERVAAVR